MNIMSTEQKAKLKALQAFLTENGMSYFSPFKSKKHDVKASLYVPKHRIIVKMSEGEVKDTEFFLKVKYVYRPLFIRESETAEFIVEKMQNLIVDIMKRKQAGFERRMKKQR